MARSKSSAVWLREHFNDEYVKKAQAEGLRSRAVYKLEELIERDHLLKPGINVVDLGAAPGSWSQLVRNRLGDSGKVFALVWVNAVAHQFPEAEIAESKRLAIDEVMSARYPDAGTSSGRDLTKRGKTRDDDAWAGYKAGKAAKLHRGVDGDAQRALEHAS